MVRSHLLRGAQVTEDAEGNPQLVITALNAGTPEEELELDVMHRPEAIGNENVAYLVFGVPETGTYSFFDLNNLPDDIKVCITINRGEQQVSKSEFSGTTGNMPQVGG